MSNVYTAIYSNKTFGVNNRVRAPLAIANGKKMCFAIPFPAEGFLTRLSVYQVPSANGGGTSTAFEVELLMSSVPFPAGQYNLTDTPAIPLETCRVQIPPTGPLTATAGNVVVLDSSDIGMSFSNFDGTQSQEVRNLYLLIKPTASVDATLWCAHIQARIENRT